MPYHDALMARSEREKAGKALRRQVQRRSQGGWTPAANRPDPISLLQAQDVGRLEYLLPIKYGRMVESPFAFLRGSAVVMAADLASTPVTGLQVQLCGDAHLSNFGVFATPERKLVFDINDFDETYPGPWEWDLKRLAASAVVAGRQNGFGDEANRNLAKVACRAYRQAMVRLAKAPIMDVWYHQMEADRVLEVLEWSSKKAKRSAEKVIKKARAHTHAQALGKLTELVDGRRQFLNDPPLLVRLSEMPSEGRKAELTEQVIEEMWLEYLASLPKERLLLLSRFRIADGALRVGGVGSVGTRCTILLLEGGDEDDALILQQKEAAPSVLEPYLTRRDYASHRHACGPRDAPQGGLAKRGTATSEAQRVVTGQRLIQAGSDIFLGWNTGAVTGTQYYWRQLKDMKGSVDVTTKDEAGLESYLALCSACLARAHARTGDAAGISGYAGKKALDKAIADFAVAYADQTERDHQVLVEAVKSGRVSAEMGV